MSDSTNPNRQPKGVPAGGQFATNLHSEPSIGIPGQPAGRQITTREDWNSIPVGKHALIQYTGREGSGPGEVVFIRFEETLRWDHGPYRMSGGKNWDSVWDNQDGVVLLDRKAANARLEAHKAAELAQAIATYREISKRQDEEIALLEKPFGGLRLALRRLWG